MLIFGPGYVAGRVAALVRASGSDVLAVGRHARAGVLALDDPQAVLAALAGATHVLSSVPPGEDGSDPVLARYGDEIASAPSTRWIGYLSSTGVYGDTGGAWVDETGPVGGGRRDARVRADTAWLAIGPQTRVFRLPGIYGPGRSAFDRLRGGRARRIDLPDQVFSRIHADDAAAAVFASLDAAATGPFNIADDHPGPQNAVIEHAAALIGIEPPPLVALDEAALPLAARAFYAENRRVANGRARRLLRWRPRFADYRSGLRAILQSEAIAAASASTSSAG